MSELSENPYGSPEPEPESESKGPNLVLLYSILALGLLAAIGFAVMVIWPFYLRR
jgi:hypothetical protein